ncbi:phage tail tape measure protein [[Clostridium] innocuum]|nr:phage tail tape measure protein [[Clostridium] innocuum]
MSQADGSIIIDTRIDEAGFSKGLNTMKTAAVAGVAAITAAIGTASVAVIKLGSEFEQANAKASTLFGDAQVDMTQYQGKMLELSTKTGLAASELGNTMYDALSAGIPASDDMSEALGFLEKNTKLAKAGFTDVNTATTATAKVLNAYKMDVSETDRIHKVLMQTQNKGITTVNELGSVLSQVTPTAASMNVAFEQVGAALANMTAQGTPTAQATTQLNQLFAELGKKGTTGQKGLEAAAEGTKYAGKSFQELMKEGVPLNEVIDLMADYAKKNGLSMIDMFSSIEAGKAALSVSGKNAQQYTENLKAMKTQTDVVGEAYDKVTDTFKEKSAKVVNSLKNVGIAAYSKFEKPLKKSMDVAQGSVDELSKQMSNGKLGKSVDKIAEAFGKLIEITAKLAEKAIPLLVNGFSFLIDHGKELTIVLAAVSGAMAAMKLKNDVIGPMISSFVKAKQAVEAYNVSLVASSMAGVQFNGTLTLGQAAIGLLTGQVTLATAATTAWNAACAALGGPIGVLVTAVAAAGAGIAALCIIMGDEESQFKKNAEAIEAAKGSYADLRESKQQAIDESASEISYYEGLRSELGRLVDANGKVKTGYEGRVDFILSELNQALGTEIKMVDGVIQKYDEASRQLDTYLEKMKASAILEAQAEAMKQAEELYKTNLETITGINEQIAEKQNALTDKMAQLREKGLSDHEIASSNDVKLMQYEVDVLESQKGQVQKVQNGILTDKATYYENLELMHNGDYESLKKINQSEVAEYDEQGNRIDKTLKERIETEKANIESLNDTIDKTADAGHRKQLETEKKNAQERLDQLITELNNQTSTVNLKAPEYSQAYSDMALKALTSFKGDTQKYFGVSSDKLQKVVDGLNSKDPKVQERARKTAEGMLKNLRSKNDEYSIAGANIIDGILNGTNSKVGNLMSYMWGVGNDLLSTFKKSLEIKSPSHKFADLSKFIPSGVAKGVRDNISIAEQSVEELSERMISSFDSDKINDMVSKAQAAVYGEQAKMEFVARTQGTTEILRTSMLKTDFSSIKATLKGVIENRIYIGDRETAHVLAPFISEEMAFQGR